MSNTESEKEIRAAMDQWAAALQTKDLEAMHKDYAEQYRIYDVGSTANSVAELKELWQQCLPYFDKPVVTYKNLVIEASADMGVAYFNSRIEGMNIPLPDEMANAWLRGTCVFRKLDGSWKCIHEHFSFPVNCETNQIIFEAA